MKILSEFQRLYATDANQMSIKKGLYKNVQRYRCKQCNKTFNYKSNTFLSRSRLTIKQWIEYIKSFILHMICKNTKEFVNISLLSVWKNIIKLLKMLCKKLNGNKLNGFVCIEEIFKNETYKGNWKEENKPFRLIYRQIFYNKSRKKLRGLSRLKVNILTTVNDQLDCF